MSKIVKKYTTRFHFLKKVMPDIKLMNVKAHIKSQIFLFLIHEISDIENKSEFKENRRELAASYSENLCM